MNIIKLDFEIATIKRSPTTMSKEVEDINEKYEKIERRFPKFVANMGEGLRDMLAKRRVKRQEKAEFKAKKRSVRKAKRATKKNKKNQ